MTIFLVRLMKIAFFNFDPKFSKIFFVTIGNFLFAIKDIYFEYWSKLSHLSLNIAVKLATWPKLGKIASNGLFNAYLGQLKFKLSHPKLSYQPGDWSKGP